MRIFSNGQKRTPVNSNSQFVKPPIGSDGQLPGTHDNKKGKNWDFRNFRLLRKPKYTKSVYFIIQGIPPPFSPTIFGSKKYTTQEKGAKKGQTMSHLFILPFLRYYAFSYEKRGRYSLLPEASMKFLFVRFSYFQVSKIFRNCRKLLKK